MSEETINVETPVEEPKAEQTSGQSDATANQAEGAILEELTQFGTRLAAVARQAWESDQRKEVETEVREGLLKAGAKLDQAAEELRANEVTQDLRTKSGEVAAKVDESDVTQEIRKGLLTGLRRLNNELSQMLDKNEPAAEAESETGDDTMA